VTINGVGSPGQLAKGYKGYHGQDGAMGNNIHANASGLNFTQPGKGAVTSTNEDCCCTLM